MPPGLANRTESKIKMKKSVLASCVLVAGLAGSEARAANEYERIAPDVPPVFEEEPTLPSGDLKTSDDETVLVAKLNGLVLIGSLGDVAADGVSGRGIDASRLPSGHPPLDRSLDPFLGRPVTLAELDRISAAIVKIYRAAGRPLVDVLIPEQDITSGTVQVAVLEFRLGEVRSEGNRHVPDERLVADIRSVPGQPIDAGALVDDIRWLNRNPFRKVRLVLERGDAFGETDIVLDTQDKRPWRVYAGADNTGSRSTGWERFFAGFNLGDLFGLGHVLSYQATTDSDLFTEGAFPHGVTSDDPRYFAHSFSYTAPLPWRHEFSLFGYYSEVHPNFGTPLTSDGSSWQVSGRYIIPLPVSWDMTHEIAFGGDFKRTDNDLAFGGTSVSSSSTDIVQAVFEWSGSRPDRWGVTTGEVELYVSPGGLSAFNDDRDYQPSATSTGRTGGKAEYAYTRLDLVRDQRLFAGLWMKGRFAGQLSTANLLPSEQIALGGTRSIRAFRESEALGDHGYRTSLELHAPLMAPLADAGIQDELDVFAFFDRGEAVLQHAAAGEEKRQTLASVGVGLTYRWSEHATLQASYGRQLVGEGIDAEDDQLFGFRLTVSY